MVSLLRLISTVFANTDRSNFAFLEMLTAFSEYNTPINKPNIKMQKTAKKVIPTIISFGIYSSISHPVKAEVCVIWDPGDTSANVRYSHNGRYEATLANATQVEVIGYKNDNKGRPWASIVQRGGFWV